MNTPAEPSDARYYVDILSIESGRLLGGGRVRRSPSTSPDAPPEEVEWCLNTRFGLDRSDVTLQFDTGLMREVTLVPRHSDEPLEYLVQWTGEGSFVPADVSPDA